MKQEKKKKFKCVIQENFPKIKEDFSLQIEQWVPGRFGLEKSLASCSYEIAVLE